MRAIGYVRVSTDKQDNSADAQERRIRAQAEAKGIELSDVIVDIDEFSGNLDRPGAKKLLELIARKQIQAVIITSLDRLTRNVRDALDLSDLFKKHGVTFISINEMIDTGSPIGEFFYTVMAALGQLERKMIGSRTRIGLQNLKRRGFPTGSKTPFGWKSAGRTPPTTGCPRGEPLPMISVPEEQAALARILELDNEGKGQLAIASIMNSEGFQTRSGTPWVQQYVFRILKAERRKATAA